MARRKGRPDPRSVPVQQPEQGAAPAPDELLESTVVPDVSDAAQIELEEPQSVTATQAEEPQIVQFDVETLSEPASVTRSDAPLPVEQAIADDRLLRARSLEDAGDIDGAVGVYRQLLREDAHNLKARTNLALLFDRLGNHDMALEQYEAGRQADPENIDMVLGATSMLTMLGRYDHAERELRRVQKLEPNRAEVYTQLGLVFFRRGRYEQAEQELRRATELAPDSAEAYLYRGEALNQLSRIDEALDCLDRAVQLRPDLSRAFYVMGILFDKKGLPQQAGMMYRKAREYSRK